MPAQPKDPLHGVTLEMILRQLEAAYGWEKMGRIVRINCFQNKPSITSSLRFLRKTPWARAKVEQMYLHHLRTVARRAAKKNGGPQATVISPLSDPS